LRLQAEDLAIEDCQYALNKALESGQTDLTTHLKVFLLKNFTNYQNKRERKKERKKERNKRKKKKETEFQ
jgi:hypothetical protein